MYDMELSVGTCCFLLQVISVTVLAVGPTDRCHIQDGYNFLERQLKMSPAYKALQEYQLPPIPSLSQNQLAQAFAEKLFEQLFILELDLKEQHESAGFLAIPFQPTWTAIETENNCIWVDSIAPKDLPEIIANDAMQGVGFAVTVEPETLGSEPARLVKITRLLVIFKGAPFYDRYYQEVTSVYEKQIDLKISVQAMVLGFIHSLLQNKPRSHYEPLKSPLLGYTEIDKMETDAVDRSIQPWMTGLQKRHRRLDLPLIETLTKPTVRFTEVTEFVISQVSYGFMTWYKSSYPHFGIIIDRRDSEDNVFLDFPNTHNSHVVIPNIAILKPSLIVGGARKQPALVTRTYGTKLTVNSTTPPKSSVTTDSTPKVISGSITVSSAPSADVANDTAGPSTPKIEPTGDIYVMPPPTPEPIDNSVTGAVPAPELNSCLQKTVQLPDQQKSDRNVQFELKKAVFKYDPNECTKSENVKQETGSVKGRSRRLWRMLKRSGRTVKGFMKKNKSHTVSNAEDGDVDGETESDETPGTNPPPQGFLSRSASNILNHNADDKPSTKPLTKTASSVSG